MPTTEKKRCEWCNRDQLYKDYHDHEWGVPNHDDRGLFEMLCLAGAQAGLSWYTILSRRENYRKAFDHFDARKMAKYNDKKLEQLLLDPGIIRNKLKVNSFIHNAKVFLEVQKEFGTFDKYIWSFVDQQPIQNHFKSIAEVPAKTDISDAMSKALLKRGFKFAGSTICYAFMQTVGMVNDHLEDCWRRKA
ncbi:DNA-3-methyladenine glycosylase I [Chitinophaga sp. Hz27]|uniref:DNA-3-methyladenine glycosylase I n=1 Tax=Chitinophaga sp. Hz27 TaxID=3347169 RepID=UPI0035E218F3